jgi:murein L,D-transpeptidase YcbB/YkuD
MVAGCGTAEPVRPLLPKAAPARPDVDVLLAPLQPPLGAALVDRVQSAFQDQKSRNPQQVRWFPDGWSVPYPRFVWEEGFARNLDPVVALCDTRMDEALPADALPCQALVSAIEAAALRQAELAALPAPPDEAALVVLRTSLLASGMLNAADSQGKILPEVADRLLGAPKRATAPAELEAWSKARDRRDEALAQVELQAFQVLLAYGHLLRGQYAAEHYKRVTERNKWSDSFRKQQAKNSERTWVERKYPSDWPKSAEEAEPLEMARLFQRITTKPADEVITSLRPAGDQYGRLIQSHKRYRQIAEAGGFERVPDLEGVRPGKRHKGMIALRKRLAQEGFPSQPKDPHHPDLFDDSLQAALLQYQELHLVKAGKPNVGSQTQKLFAVPALEKQARIAASLATWRQALPRPDYYVEVNIPDYHLEIWRDGKRVDRHRIVVGSSKQERDDKGERIRPNATPTFHAEISFVVYQPFWNIPKRILEEEVLDDDARQLTPEEQISWLEGKGFEVVKPGSRFQYVRQLPGRENPLGQVKILFPNEHDVYLHDTPAKSLFNQPRRAYSHGCMRVHQPLRLARTLLELDGRYNEDAVQTWLREDEQKTVSLEKPVPIYIEYVTVRVDEHGRAWFLPDIYDRVGKREPPAMQTAKRQPPENQE